MSPEQAYLKPQLLFGAMTERLDPSFFIVRSTVLIIHVRLTLPSHTHTALSCCSWMESFTLPYHASLDEFRSMVAKCAQKGKHKHEAKKSLIICYVLSMSYIFKPTGEKV